MQHDTVIGTNTSSMSIDLLAHAMARPRAADRAALLQPDAGEQARRGRPADHSPAYTATGTAATPALMGLAERSRAARQPKALDETPARSRNVAQVSCAHSVGDAYACRVDGVLLVASW